MGLNIIRQYLANPLIAAAFWVVMVLATAACVGDQSSDLVSGTPAKPMSVITTIPVLADLARNVGGVLIEVNSLVPPGADLHSYQTTPDDSVAISRAGLIILNGAGLDDFALPVLMAAKAEFAVQVTVSDGLFEESSVEFQNDPHFWQDPLLAIHYVERIREGLTLADPANVLSYKQQANEYILRLNRLDREISETLNRVPVELRQLVTYHHAFTHLGRRYGWQTYFLAAGDGDAPTPSAILKVSQAIQDAGLPTVFMEPQLPTSALESTAGDLQVSVTPIYIGLSNTHPSTYVDMMLFNANSLADNLK